VKQDNLGSLPITLKSNKVSISVPMIKRWKQFTRWKEQGFLKVEKETFLGYAFV